jgi:hypothetical protein
MKFEDVAAAVDDMNLLALPPRPSTRVTRLSNRMRRVAGHPERYTEPAIRHHGHTRVPRLFLLAVFALVSDIPHRLWLRRWRDRCEKAACVSNELLAHQIAESTPYLQLLARIYIVDREQQLHFRRAIVHASIQTRAAGRMAGSR